MAVRFDNSADELRRTANLPDDAAFTLCGWGRRITATAALESIGSIFQDATNYVLMAYDPGGSALTVYANGVTTSSGVNPGTGTDFFWFMSSGGTGVGQTTAGARLASSPALSTANSAGTRPAFAPAALTIGNVVGNGILFNGRVWNVKCWDRQLTNAELLVESYYRRVMYPSSINFYWPLDTHTDLNDYSGNGRAATSAGTLTTEDSTHGLWTPTRRIFLPVAAATNDITASGSLSITGSADLDATGSLAAAGTLSITGAADLDATGSLAAAGSLAITGAADLDATGALAAAGSLSISGAADLDATGTLAAAGTLSITGAADLTGASENSLDASGSLSITGAASLNAIGQLLAAGSISITGAADLDATGALAASGSLSITGAADLTAPSANDIEAAGSLSITGSASLTAIGQLLAAGSIVITGAASLDDGIEDVEPESTQKPAGRKRKKRRYVVDVDGQEFIVESVEHAQAIVERARELAHKAANAQAEQIEQKTLQARSLGKVKPVHIPAPVIKTNAPIALKEIQSEIDSIYAQAAQALEMRLIFERAQRLEEEALIELLL